LFLLQARISACRYLDRTCPQVPLFQIAAIRRVARYRARIAITCTEQDTLTLDPSPVGEPEGRRRARCRRGQRPHRR
jgi:hypothetical protein